MTMNRKAFLGGSLKLAAGIGLGCPCLGWGVDVPQESKAGTGGPAVPCGKLAGDYPHATSFEKRADFGKKWVGRFMRVLDERLDEKTRRALMEENGRRCAIGAYGPPDPAQRLTDARGAARVREERGEGVPVQGERGRGGEGTD